MRDSDASIFPMIESLVLMAVAIPEPNVAALDVLSRYGAAERSGSVAEIKLAETVAQLEQLLGVQKATYVRS